MRRALVAAAMLSTSAFVAVGGAPRAAAQSRRPLEPADIFELKTVSDPRITAWIKLILQGLVGLGVSFGVLAALKVEELAPATKRFTRLIKRA